MSFNLSRNPLMKTRRLFVSLAVCALGLLPLTGAASAGDWHAGGGVYASDNISIFELPRNQANEIVGMLRAGEEVRIDRCTPSQNWCRVFHDGPTGWVPGSYLIGAAAKNNETPQRSLASPPFDSGDDVGRTRPSGSLF
jgi:hypothetical protein